MRKRKQEENSLLSDLAERFQAPEIHRPKNRMFSCESQRSTVFHFWLILGRRRSLWVGGLAAFFLLICLSSFYVWDISFEGNHRFTDETLLHFMATVPVQCGMRKSRISCTELEKRIRNAFPEISWVSAELTGTRLTIHLRENNRILQARLEPESPCELTAGTDGTVTRIIVRNGKARVKVGDTVKAGDVLVSGELPLYDDFETLVKINKVHADAEVYAKTTRTVEWKCPETKEIRARTGKRRRGIFFKFLDLEFCFLMPDLKKESTWELFMEESQLKTFEKFLSPGLRRNPHCRGICSLRKSPHGSRDLGVCGPIFERIFTKFYRKRYTNPW